MYNDDILNSERCETIDELSELFQVVQEMGRRLSNETHGPAYADVRRFNEMLLETRQQLERIKAGRSAW